MGRLISTEALDTARHRVVIDFPIAATADDPAQFLNVLFGNSSLPGTMCSWPTSSCPATGRDGAGRSPVLNSAPPACASGSACPDAR